MSTPYVVPPTGQKVGVKKFLLSSFAEFATPVSKPWSRPCCDTHTHTYKHIATGRCPIKRTSWPASCVVRDPRCISRSFHMMYSLNWRPFWFRNFRCTDSLVLTKEPKWLLPGTFPYTSKYTLRLAPDLTEETHHAPLSVTSERTWEGRIRKLEGKEGKGCYGRGGLPPPQKDGLGLHLPEMRFSHSHQEITSDIWRTTALKQHASAARSFRLRDGFLMHVDKEGAALTSCSTSLSLLRVHCSSQPRLHWPEVSVSSRMARLRAQVLSVTLIVCILFSSAGCAYQISWSRAVCVCVCVCLDVNQGGTNSNRCTQRLVIIYTRSHGWTLIARQN